MHVREKDLFSDSSENRVQLYNDLHLEKSIRKTEPRKKGDLGSLEGLEPGRIPDVTPGGRCGVEPSEKVQKSESRRGLSGRSLRRALRVQVVA